jgi:hypothetical protein
MEEVASDEELLMLMENFVTRIEVSQDRMRYIQVGRQLMCYISIECYVIFVFTKSGQIFYCSREIGRSDRVGSYASFKGYSDLF